MKYKVTAWAEVAVDAIVEAESKDEAKEKVEDALYAEDYIDSVGIESNDDDVEVEDYDICNDFKMDYIEKEGE